MIVLDASAVVSWLLEEPNPAPALDSLVAMNRIHVPAHWSVEVGHAVLKALRTGRVADKRLLVIDQVLNDLDLSIAPPLDASRFLVMLNFARQHGLSMYDAGYVDLAMTQRAPLATLDNGMRKAAENLGVELVL